MKSLLLTEAERSHTVTQLSIALKKKGHEVYIRPFSTISIRPDRLGGPIDYDVAFLRLPGITSFELTFFRMASLHWLIEDRLLINSPKALETTSSKIATDVVLSKFGISIPIAAAHQQLKEALEDFKEIGGNVLVKPLYGSGGRGIIHVTDYEMARRVFSSIIKIGEVVYMQEYIEDVEDVRVLVCNGKVVSAMRRHSVGKFKNILKGAKPRSISLTDKEIEISIKAASVTGCILAGVDLLRTKSGTQIIEINGSPSWRGLQQVTNFNIAEYIIEEIESILLNQD